ncbi:zinc finger matrin-type protein 1 isoform X2 [Xiphophorus couchianus]|uniref:zinc finger matrin-type protein 1 isoform X2 n=1 Tax=Xiphophorus couchianus TaxID=32473 RepID=UPI001016F21C|nr:zinc finger matrin-type protein 1-like isoform X2 [Xiphophorus couchianus]
MEASAVCALQPAESDAKNNTSGSLSVASVTDSETVINSKTDSTMVKEQKSDEELLQGLLTDYYCHICSSNLMFEANRVAHYEGKQHSQKVKTYLNAMRADLGRGCQNMSHDKNSFCELCYVVFSSHVVAKSHYEGKIHAKNLRKRSLLVSVKDTAVHNSPAVTQDPVNSDQNSSQEDDPECHPEPTPTSNISAFSNTGVDLKDPNKYCALCVASFNNPQMALQHYNGRKHQKKMARQELLKAHGKDAQQGSSFMCQMCGVSTNSLKMYQAHMQGNKHQIREKKLRILFKSQPKVYSTFADELADYIQVQKVRGITPKTSEGLPEENTQNDNCKEEEEVQHKDVNQCDLTAVPVFLPHFPQISLPPPQPNPGPRFAFAPAPSWPPIGWPYSVPPPHPLLPSPSSTQFIGRPTDTGPQRRLSTSSTCTTSSSFSSHSSDGSESDECESRNTERRRTKRHREYEESDAAERRTKRQRMERSYDSEDRRREQFGESGEERSGKKLKAHRKRTRKQKTCQQEDFEADQGGNTTDSSHSQTKTNAECSKSGHSKSGKPRKEKKKAKEVVDTRTEEEKLWDDSILGC